MPSLTCNNLTPRLTLDPPVSRYIHASLLTNVLPCHTDFGTFCSMSSLSLLMLVFTVAHTPLQLLEKTYLGNLVHQGMTTALSSSSVMACLLVLGLFLNLESHLAMKLSQ